MDIKERPFSLNRFQNLYFEAKYRGVSEGQLLREMAEQAGITVEELLELGEEWAEMAMEESRIRVNGSF